MISRTCIPLPLPDQQTTCLKVLLIVLLADLSGGCAFGVTRIRVKHGALVGVSQQREGRILVKRFMDRRKNTEHIGTKRNIMGVPLGNFGVEEGVQLEVLMTRCFVEALRNSGYQAFFYEPGGAGAAQDLSRYDAVLDGEIRNFWMDAYAAVWHSIEVRVRLRNPAGKVLWSKRIRGKQKNPLLVGVTTEFEKVVRQALTKMLNQATRFFASRKFYSGIRGLRKRRRRPGVASRPFSMPTSMPIRVPAAARVSLVPDAPPPIPPAALALPPTPSRQPSASLKSSTRVSTAAEKSVEEENRIQSPPSLASLVFKTRPLNIPIESGALHGYVDLQLTYIYDSYSNYNRNTTKDIWLEYHDVIVTIAAQYAFADRFELGLTIPFLRHTRLDPNWSYPPQAFLVGDEKNTGFGDLILNLKSKIFGSSSGLVAGSLFTNVMFPTTSWVEDREYAAIHGGIAASGKVSVVTIGGDTGGYWFIQGEDQEDLVHYLLDLYCISRFHRVVAAYLALRFAVRVHPETDTPTFTMVPGVKIFPVKWLHLDVGGEFTPNFNDDRGTAQDGTFSITFSTGYMF